MLVLLALLKLTWLIRSRRKKRQSMILAAISVLVYAVVNSESMVVLAIQELVGSFPADSGTTVDTIVVLGRGEKLRDSRTEMAIQLWEAKRARSIFVSGMMDAPQITEQLQAKGIPRQVLSGESCSQNTEENALFTAAVLHPQGIRRILLITDLPHMLRSFLTFRSFGFTVIPHTSPLPPHWTFKQKSLVVFRECLGSLGYALWGRFQPRPDSEIKHPPALVLERLSTWHCRL
ncbi:MAG: YdcF family protein [Chroococcidiopsidaceae cyanobacterium CP_BM_RX_35]|nr:YdcF family protein [Chroococcidiopsidaceae cyanobacterium CP_BM_RX_35]